MKEKKSSDIRNPSHTIECAKCGSVIRHTPLIEWNGSDVEKVKTLCQNCKPKNPPLRKQLLEQFKWDMGKVVAIMFVLMMIQFWLGVIVFIAGHLFGVL